jgi:hypothetical protein
MANRAVSGGSPLVRARPTGLREVVALRRYRIDMMQGGRTKPG